MRTIFTDAATERAVATLQAMIDSSERVEQPMEEVPFPFRGGPCFACARLAEHAVVFRLNGEDVAYVNACGDHKDVPVTVSVP